MKALRSSQFVVLLSAFLAVARLLSQQSAAAPLPDVRALIQEVREHQKKLDKTREDYTYSSLQTTQEFDSSGQVKKTESEEGEDFFVNGHVIERTVKKNGQPLSEHDQQKETERVTKLVEKAQKTPPDQALEDPTISLGRLLAIMDVNNPRRENYRGRPSILFDFVGRKDAKTHGIAEDASKKLAGTVWIDEADRQIAHIEVRFNDNFRIGGGLVASVQKGTSFTFDQGPVSGGLWLPTGAEGNIQARALMVKNVRRHFVERVYDYKRFRVDAEQGKDAKAVTRAKP